MRYQILAAVVLAAGFLIASSMDYDDAARAESDYCAAVAEWKHTGGHGGHPDYEGNAEEVCK